MNKKPIHQIFSTPILRDAVSMRSVCGLLIICFLLVIGAGFKDPTRPVVGVERAVAYIKAESAKFSASATELQNAIAAIVANNPNTLEKARSALVDCRLKYKRIEFFLAYFFKSSAIIYNMPPKAEIEEPYMEYQEPAGLQVIEGLLFEKNVAEKIPLLLQQADVISSSARDLDALLFGFTAVDRQLLESIRLQLIRVITMGITGFDAPLLKSGIAESESALRSASAVLQPFLIAGNKQSDSVSKYLAGSIQFLHAAQCFDSFDRLAFLTGYALPLERHIHQLIKDLDLELNTTGGVLNYEAGDVFNRGFLNIPAFPQSNNPGTAHANIGRKLFFETGLSGNNKISCATCHDPAKHFTDGLQKSIAFDGHSEVKRNAATLLYSGFQYEQFWDGRAKSLEEQIRTVISDPNEMNSGPAMILNLLKHKPEYLELFGSRFPAQQDSAKIINTVAAAISAYVNELNPRNSRFDKYMEGDTSRLNPSEKRGFNLFMGKAQCGTCHFAPLFNGLVPPYYNLTELEVLGTPKSDNLNHPEPDTDPGRFAIFPMSPYQKAFKTPTVRNVSATAPYMHNGSFKTLEAVLEFYNKGGGTGLGLQSNNQTLSAEPLNLSDKEKGDIIAFLQSLEDSLSVQQ